MKKYLSVIPLVLLLCFVVGCQDKAAMAELEQFKAQAALEEQNKQLVIRIFEELDRHNYDIYDEFYAEDIVAHFPPIGTFTHEAFKKSGQESYAEMPDYTHTIEDILAKGDKVVARLTNRGTDKETGKKIEFSVILIQEFHDGKVTELWALVDLLGQYQQLGYELTPKETRK